MVVKFPDDPKKKDPGPGLPPEVPNPDEAPSPDREKIPEEVPNKNPPQNPHEVPRKL